MLFCKSSTVKVGTIALICTASCVVATIASFCFVVFVHPQASGPRPDLQARPCEKNFCGDGKAWAVAAAPRGAAVARRSVTYIDLTAREKWFFQAQVESPAMFRRTAGAGSLYWLGTRDASGAYLDGGNAYRLRVPQP
jgi:hypothetical protein